MEINSNSKLLTGNNKQDKDASSASLNQNFRQLASGGSIVFIGRMVSTGVKYITQLVLAWMLGANILGIYSLGMAFYQLLEILAGSGLQSGTVRFVSIHRAKGDNQRLKGTLLNAIKFPIIFGSSIGILLFLNAEFLSKIVFNKPELSTALKIFSITLPFGSGMSVLAFASTGFQKTNYFVYILHIIQPLMNLLFIVVLCNFGLGLLGASAAWCIAAFIGFFYSVYFIFKIFPGIFLSKIQPISDAKKLLSFSFPLLSGSFLWVAVLWTDIIMIGLFKSAAEVGVYRVASQTAFLATVVTASIATIFAPKVAQFHENQDLNSLSETYKVATRWSFTLTLPICLVIGIGAKEILNIFGNDFQIGWLIVIILCGGHLIIGATGNAASVLIMTGNHIAKMIGDLILTVVNVILNLLFIPRYGILGAAFATCISLSGINIIRLFQVYFIVRIQPYNVKYAKALFAGILAGLAGVIIHRQIPFDHFLFSLFLTSTGILITYFGFIFVFSVEETDRMILTEIKKKYSNNFT